jgi:Domain of Unknown Function (DUF1080)
VPVKGKFYKQFAALPLVVSLVVVAFAALPYCRDLHGEAKGRWITLLDGKNLDNWNPIGNANWHLMAGSAVADTYDECLIKQSSFSSCLFNNGMGYLVSKSSYTDFEIHAEFWVSHDANSGVFIRCAEPQNIRTDKNIRTDNCYEANINDERPSYGTGAITNLVEPSIALRAGGKWNTYDITAHGPYLVLILNGTKTVDLQDSKDASGYIALQAVLAGLTTLNLSAPSELRFSFFRKSFNALLPIGSHRVAPKGLALERQPVFQRGSGGNLYARLRKLNCKRRSFRNQVCNFHCVVQGTRRIAHLHNQAHSECGFCVNGLSG